RRRNHSLQRKTVAELGGIVQQLPDLNTIKQGALLNVMRRLGKRRSCRTRRASVRIYGSQPRRDGRASMKMTSTWSIHNWRPKVGWGVPVAWLTLCVVWSSTWLVIKFGLRELPPISYAGIRFLLA